MRQKRFFWPSNQNNQICMAYLWIRHYADIGLISEFQQLSKQTKLLMCKSRNYWQLRFTWQYWWTLPCSLEAVCWCFRGSCCTVIMAHECFINSDDRAEGSSDTLVHLRQTTHGHIPENSNLHNHLNHKTIFFVNLNPISSVYRLFQFI